MPKILTREELYRILQRELPEGMYPDGAPSGHLSTASMYAKALEVEDIYQAASSVYDEIFPASATFLLNEWETTIFNQVSDATKSVIDRRATLLAQIRSRRGIRKVDMEDVTRVVLGESLDFEIVEWQSASGGWIIGVSELGLTTFLGLHSLVTVTGADINCEIARGETSLTPEEIQNMRIQSFTYEVRIYNQTLTAAEKSALDTALTKAEPARCAHVITDGLSDSDKIGV